LFPTNSNSSTQSLFGNIGGSTGSLFPAPIKPANREEDDGGDGDDGEADDVPDEPSKQAAKAVNEDEEILYEADPAKIMMFNGEEKQWNSKGGKGRLVVSRDKKTGKYRVVLRAGTTGNLYFNAPLNSSMKGSLNQQKKSVSLTTVSYKTDEQGKLVADNNGKPVVYRIMVQTEDEAGKLLNALEKAMS
jgi:hypothetical protein